MQDRPLNLSPTQSISLTDHRRTRSKHEGEERRKLNTVYMDLQEIARGFHMVQWSMVFK